MPKDNGNEKEAGLPEISGGVQLRAWQNGPMLGVIMPYANPEDRKAIERARSGRQQGEPLVSV